MAITLANTCTTRYGFIDEEFAEIICQVLKIKLQRLIKLKQIQRFDGRPVKSITHAIDLSLTIGIHIENLALLWITKLGNHPMIFG